MYSRSIVINWCIIGAAVIFYTAFFMCTALSGNNGNIVSPASCIIITGLLILLVLLYRRNRQLQLDKEAACAEQNRLAGLLAESIARVQELKEQNEYIKTEERKKLGAELHDDLGATLAAVNIQLQSAACDVTGTELHKKLLCIAGQVTVMYQNTRMKSHGLYYTEQYGAGCEFAEEVVSFTDCILPSPSFKKDIFIDDAIKNTTAATKTTLLYIIREAVTNISRHANATKISIKLYKNQKGIILKIYDNGTGFNKHLRHQIKGIGLESIKKRIAELEASLDIVSTHRGTGLTVIVPRKDAVENAGNLKSAAVIKDSCLNINTSALLA